MNCNNCTGCSGCAGGGRPGPLTGRETTLLEELAENAFLPAARFLIRSEEEPELSFVMSAPVYLRGQSDSAEEVRAWGTALLSLRRRGAIVLDYGTELKGFDYGVWEHSDYYQRFAFSVEAPGAVPFLERGSVALTVQGQELLDEL